MQSLVEVRDLKVRYGAFEAVKGVSFTLGKGEILGIVGESGSGKSTIAKTLVGLEKPSAGEVVLCARSVQMVFQDAVGSLNPRMTVRQTLDETLKFVGNREATAESLLAQVGLSTAVLDQYPREMSGGQCQRVSVARALACRPDVLVADEPVSALDVSVQARVLNLLRDLRRDLGLSIVLVAHDLAVVKNVCDRICVMEKGRFVDEGDAEAVFANPKSAYTKRLLEAVPSIPRALALAAFAAVGSLCAAAGAWPSPAACVRACPDGAASAPRLWNGIAPAVKAWELGRRGEALDRVVGLAYHRALPAGASAEKPVPVVLCGWAGAEAAVPTNAVLARGAAAVWWSAPSPARFADPDRIAAGNSRALDWIRTQRELDATRVTVAGRGPNAILALETAARDERFALALALDLGVASRAAAAERLADLLSLLAPRPAFVSGATDAAATKAVAAANTLYAAYKLPERLVVAPAETDAARDWAQALAFADATLRPPASVDSDAIDARLAKAVADGSRTVTLGRNPASADGVWRPVRAILLPDDFTLVLDGCRLEQPFGTQDNFIRNAGAVEGASQPNRNIRILGRNGATLSAGTRNSYLPRRSGDPNGWRAVGILLCDVSDYEIAGLAFEETQCWAISQERCARGRIHDLVFGSTDRFFNQDGVDVRKGCHDLTIENIRGMTGDDAVALTAYRDPPGRPARYGMQIGGNDSCGEADDVYNVTIRNVHARSAGGHGVIRLLVCDGIRMHHVTVEDVVDTATGDEKRPQATIRIGDVHYHKTRRCAMGEMHHVIVRGVKASGKVAVWLKGPLCDSEIVNITPGPNGRRYDITAPLERVRLDP